MPDLRLSIEGAEVVQYAAAPLLAFKVRITNDSEPRKLFTRLRCEPKSRSK